MLMPANVLLQRLQVEEVLGTVTAAVRAHSIVELTSSHAEEFPCPVWAVVPQVEHAVDADAVKSGEEAATDVTFVLSGSRVCRPSMLEYVGTGQESLATAVTVVQALHRREHFMSRELQAETEGTSAAFAAQGQLVRMFGQVLAQGFRKSKSLSTFQAAVGLYARVNKYMPQQDGCIFCRVQTEWTEVALLRLVTSLVGRRRRRVMIAWVFHLFSYSPERRH